MIKRRLNADIPRSVSEFQSIIKSFELKTKLYRTILKGKGLDFDGYRVYTPEDDASSIDWKISKKANQLLVKKYIEEQNLKVIFLIDVSENMVFGSTKKLKCEYAAEIIASLTKLIMDSGNKVGYILFSDRIKEFVKPGRGDRHFNRFMDVLTDASIYGGVSNLRGSLDFALNYLSKSTSSVVIISDFIRVDEELKEKLTLISHRFETMAVMVRDPLDMTLPDISGELILEDSSTGQRLLINPSIAKKSYEKYAALQDKLVKNIFRKNGIDILELITDKPFVINLATFLRERTKTLKNKISL